MSKMSLKAARINANLLQTDVASAIGVNKSTIISWEKERTFPDVLQLQKLCELYKVPIDDIFLRSEFSLREPSGGNNRG